MLRVTISINNEEPIHNMGIINQDIKNKDGSHRYVVYIDGDVIGLVNHSRDDGALVLTRKAIELWESSEDE